MQSVPFQFESRHSLFVGFVILANLAANLYKPVNPKFDAFAKTNSNSTKGTYQPDTWGTWDLVAVIPKASLPSLAPATTAGYNYKYEDKDVILGFRRASNDRAAVAVVFTGAGTRSFCSGAAPTR